VGEEEEFKGTGSKKIGNNQKKGSMKLREVQGSGRRGNVGIELRKNVGKM
jgi:hypothetical protein